MVTLSPDDLAMLQRFQNGQGDQGSGISDADLAAMQAPITAPPAVPSPQDFVALQPQALYQQPAVDPRTQQMDQAVLDQVATPPAATQDSGSGGLPPSDPNGFIPRSGQAQQGDIAMGPDGKPLLRPPNSGAANSYGGQPAPQQSQTAASPENAASPPDDWVAYLKSMHLDSPDILISDQLHRELVKGFNQLQLKKLELQDPEKQIKLQQARQELANAPLKTQNLQAQTAESQSKVIAGELAKQQAMDAVNNQLADLQTQRDNLIAVANHPELKNMTGMAGQYNYGITAPQRDLKARLEQISGQQLIGGINKIKDEASNPNGSLGMRITQQEALAVKNAVQRLQRYQDPATFTSSANEAAGFLDRAIAAKQAQLARMPSVNQDLLKQFSYSPAPSAAPVASSSPAPVIKTIPGRGTFQSLGNGQWKQIQ